jgi:phosphate transport system permease protein
MALQPEISGTPRVPSAAAAPAGAQTSLMPDQLEIKKPPKAISGGTSRLGDRAFKAIAIAAGLTIVIAIALIAVFLLVRAVPSLRANEANFFTSAQFSTIDAHHLKFGIRDLFMVTVLSSVFALALAVPIAIGIALFLTQYAPARLSRPLSVMVDLLAAVPSIIFGLWGIFILAPKLEPVARFLNRNLGNLHFGWFHGLFLFKQGNVSLAGGGTIFTAGIVLAVMILPIITSVSREVFRQAPIPHIEAAQALGATKWEVIRMTVLPYGRSGVIAASMLGLGRALGETVAVLIILRSAAQPGHWSLFDGGYTFASKIASAAAEFSAPLPTGAYIAAGFVLFALTFVVNATARFIAGGKVNG